MDVYDYREASTKLLRRKMRSISGCFSFERVEPKLTNYHVIMIRKQRAGSLLFLRETIHTTPHLYNLEYFWANLH